MQPKKIPQAEVIITRIPVIPEHRLRLLVRARQYSIAGIEPVDPHDCPYYQQYHFGTSCRSGSGGSCCGSFGGTTPEGSTQCTAWPSRTRPGQVFLILPEDDPDPARQHAGWN